jgi:hypothetical protein
MFAVLTRRQLVQSLATLGVLAAPGWAVAQVAVGHAAPGFSLVAADGKTVTLQSLRGKTVVLE